MWLDTVQYRLIHPKETTDTCCKWVTMIKNMSRYKSPNIFQLQNRKITKLVKIIKFYYNPTSFRIYLFMEPSSVETSAVCCGQEVDLE